MTKRYVAAVSDMTKDEESSFVGYLRSQRMAWWHWISNFWLVVDKEEKLSAEAIRDKLGDIASPGRCVVIEVESITWAGWQNSEKMFAWIESTWDKED